MKSKITSVGVLILLFLSLPLAAQVPIVRHSFSSTPDGGNPTRLFQPSGLLFGGAVLGGTNGDGCLFRLDTNTLTFTNFYSFTGAANNGSNPNDVLVAGGLLFGTTEYGGSNDLGVVYLVGTNGQSFKQLHSFGLPADGQNPVGGVILGGGTLYGTTYGGGSGSGAAAGGTIFMINTNGSGYATLHSFTNTPDGAQPQSELALGGRTLYGITTSGGAFGNGMVFAINTNGTGYTNLYSFQDTPDAIHPYGGLVLNAGVLYGVGSSGGSNETGAIFALGTNGSGYKILYNFSPFAGNADGTIPRTRLTLVNGSLYGTTVSGGTGNGGTIFLINTNGTGFTVITSFTNGSAEGSEPLGGVIRAGNALWGTTFEDGAGEYGTLYELPMPAITLQPQGQTVIGAGVATFTVSAVDDRPISYRWYFNTNTLLSGQTNNTLSLTNPTTANAGTYVVVASDGTGSVTSSPAALTVVTKPVITEAPQNVTVKNGEPSSFASAATGPGVLSYQWLFQTNGLVPGATNTSLAFTNTYTTLAGYYAMRVTNTYGSVTSSYARLTVQTQLAVLSFNFSQPEGSAAFAVANAVGSTNRLWASSNLAGAWFPLATNVMAADGLWFYIDPHSAQSNSVRLYRFSSP